MKYRIEVTARAEADIEEAYAWYAERSPEGAARWHGELSRAINTLERFPERCPVALVESEAVGLDIRRLVVGRLVFPMKNQTLEFQRALKMLSQKEMFDPPQELFAIDQERIFGLTIKAESLLQIRQARLKHLGMPPDTSYGQRDHISREIAYAQVLFRQHASWPVIDVTRRAIEETAVIILETLREREEKRARMASGGGEM